MFSMNPGQLADIQQARGPSGGGLPVKTQYPLMAQEPRPSDGRGYPPMVQIPQQPTVPGGLASLQQLGNTPASAPLMALQRAPMMPRSLLGFPGSPVKTPNFEVPTPQTAYATPGAMPGLNPNAKPTPLSGYGYPTKGFRPSPM